MKKFGIKVTLTDGNPMRQPHLLGNDWQNIHWYDTEEERDAALVEMDRQLPNYRKGDIPAEVHTKVEQ